MSLINEALRKARQAAAEHDDQRMAGRPPQAYPSRGRRRGVGPAVVVLVAVLAGLAGATGVWWIVGTAATDPASTDVANSQSPPRDGPGGSSSDATNDVAPTSEVVQQPDDRSDRKSEPAPPTRPETATATPETAALESELPPAPSVGEKDQPVITKSGARVFIMDAELGYASLSLGYIVFRPVRPFAEINGKDVYEGSEIGGFTVEKIEIDRVVLRDERGRLELRVP